MLLSNSSQPYLFNIDNDTYMLYCSAASNIDLSFGANKYTIRPWKVHLYNLQDDSSIVLQTPAYVDNYGQCIIECNPHIKVIDNIIKLYYTVGFIKDTSSPILYHVCSLTSNDLTFSSLSDFQIVYKTFTGTPTNNPNELLCIEKTYNQDLLVVKNMNNSANNRIINNDFDIVEILRLTNIYNTDKFLLTGKDSTYNYKSYILNNDFSIYKRLLNSLDQDIYKCSILGNMLAFTVQNQSDNPSSVEDRSIVIENIVNS